MLVAPQYKQQKVRPAAGFGENGAAGRLHMNDNRHPGELPGEAEEFPARQKPWNQARDWTLGLRLSVFFAFSGTWQPPLPLHEFLPAQPWSPLEQPPSPLHSFRPLHSCLATVAHAPFPLHSFLPATPLGPPPWPLQSFIPLQTCLAVLSVAITLVTAAAALIPATAAANRLPKFRRVICSVLLAESRKIRASHSRSENRSDVDWIRSRLASGNAARAAILVLAPRRARYQPWRSGEPHFWMNHPLSISVIRSAAAVACCLGLAGCAPSGAVRPARTNSAPYRDARFWAHWSDGQAEISSYDLTYPRYGSPRTGTALAIFVTEPFSLAARVKADAGKHPQRDLFPVMKLNLVEDFQTGIYDYNEQISSFLALEANAHQRAGYLTKASFSSQEWCGHSWAQWILQPKGLQYAGHSYFDGEADRSALIQVPPGGIVEEQLMFWARGMAEPRLSPGQECTAPFRRSLQFERHSHREARWLNARLSREGVVRRVLVPAGEFEAETWRAELLDGPTLSFRVEAAEPHRVLEWNSTDGERAVLVKSVRMRYWEMNKPGGESELSRLGLRQRPARTP